MQKSFRTTLVLAGLLIVAVVWYAVYEQRIKPKHAEEEEKTKELVTLGRDQIQEIDLTRWKNPPPDNGPPGAPKATATPELETVKLRKTGTDWNIAEPIQAAADGATIGTLLNTLTTTKQERVVDEKPKDLDEYGLKIPLVKIVVRKDAASPALEVDVGANTPTGFSSYVKVGGKDAVFRAARTLRTTFDKDVKALRDKSVTNIPRYEVGEVEIQNPKENIVMKKDEKDNWTLERDNMPADGNEWNKTLNALTDLKATDFVPPSENLKPFGLKPPEVKVTLTRSKDKSRTSVWFGTRRDGKVYAQRQDKREIYEVSKDILEKLERPSLSYRNMQLALFNRFDVTRLKLERSHDTLEFFKDKSDWVLASDPKAKLDNAKVDGLLTALQDIKISKFTKGEVSDPMLTIRLFEKKDKNETEHVSLAFGKAKDKEIIVERSGLDVPFTIKETDFRKVDLGREAFFPPPPKFEPPKEAKKEAAKKS